MNRSSLIWSLLVVTALFTVACGPAAPAAQVEAPAEKPQEAALVEEAAPTEETTTEVVETASEETTTETETPEIFLALGGEEADGYDPTLGWGRYGSPLFQSTLLRRDENLNIVNDLAERYSVSDDGLVWTIKIREDVVFSDGQTLTAEDVAYTFTKAGESGGLTDVTVLEKATATGDYEVELRLKQPQSTFINRLMTLGIVPKHAHNENYGRNPIGSGPYKLVQWDEGQQLIVEANPLYYGEPPHLKRLTFLFMDEDTAFAAAKAGKVHLVGVPQTLAVQEIPEMTLHRVKSVDNRGLLFPFQGVTEEKTPEGYPIGNDVTADLVIRQAVNYILDRQALVEGVLEGYGSPAYGPVSSLPWEELGSVIEDNVPETAQQILAEGGWTDTDGDGIVEKEGLKAEFTIIYPASDSTRQALALAAADMINQLGIQANVEGKSWDEITELKHSNVVVFGWGSHDQTEMYNLYHSSTGGIGWYNTGYYGNEAVDNYLDLAMGAPSQEEAYAFWKSAQWDGEGVGFTTPGDAAWAWLVNLDHTYFVSNCLDIGQSQVEPHGHGWPITANIDKWKWTCE